MENIRNKLSLDLRDAMKQGDTTAVETIRSLISDIDNAGAVFVKDPEIMPMSGNIAGATSGLFSTEVERKDLSESDIKDLIKKEIDDILKTIDMIKDNSKIHSDKLSRKIEILKKYL